MDFLFCLCCYFNALVLISLITTTATTMDRLYAGRLGSSGGGVCVVGQVTRRHNRDGSTMTKLVEKLDLTFRC
jgi:hypothetical protein